MASDMAEIVYGTKEEGHVMSEKVSQLAASVYSEFEKMIKKYDEDVVKELMPLVVGILESLDMAYIEKQEADVDMELLREDNEQLLTQYEREKQLRKAADQKYLEAEDETEEYKKQMEEKVENLESQTRMLELKIKNASDHATRMEDKEVELKKEYNKVHERYTELMRTHMDYMERAKMLMGTDRIADMANSPRSSFSRKGSFRLSITSPSPFDLGGFQLPNLKPVNMISMTGSTPLKSTGSPPDASAFDMISPRSGKDSNQSLQSELSDMESPDINSNHARQVVVNTKTSDKEQNTDTVDVREFATGTKTSGEKDGTPVEHPVSKENKARVTSDIQTNAESETKTSNSSNVESGSNLVLDNAKQIAEEKESVEIENQTQPKSTESASENMHASTNEMISETKSSEGVNIETNVKAKPTESTEKTLEDKSESTVIVNSKSIDSSNAEKVMDSTSKTTPDIKLNLDDTTNSESVVKGSGLVPVSPQSPSSPLYDEGDFGFEEDPLPVMYKGLDDTLAHIVATTPELDDMEESMESGNSNNTPSRRNNTSIFDELTIQDADIIGDVDFGADITGRAVNPADYASSDSEDEREDRNSNVSDNFFGMSRELENLILENTELLATKNALNIVKDDLIAKVDELTSEQEILKEEISTLKGGRTKLQERIKELEDDLKKTKDDLEKKVHSAQEAENEDDVPMAQRKRFTRVEMARVLMERNQYKERLMELQEAVRWTEMIRASREHPEIAPSKKKSSIWNFFGNLFNSPNKPSKKPLPMAMVKYNAPTTNVQPVGDPNQKSRSKYNLGDKSKAYDFLQDDLRKSLGEPIVTQPDTSEKAKKEREKERKEQYKQVRAHVKKDDGRMQAYGWSLPAKFQPQLPAASPRNSVPVPVPVYCRPLLETDTALKIWCAAGVNLTGGKTKDGGSIVGASVFYSNPPESEPRPASGTEVDKLDRELKEHEDNVKQSEKEQLSSFVWICTSTNNHSRASVIDANNPGDVLETFRVSTTPILCIASVPGALESDYPVDEDILKAESYPQYFEQKSDENKDKEGGEDSGIGGISLVQCATGGSGGSKPGSPMASPPRSRDGSPTRPNITEAVSEALSKEDSVSDHSGSSASLNDARFSRGSIQSLDLRGSQDSLIANKRVSQGSLASQDKGEVTQPTVFKARGSPVSSGTATPEMSGGIASRRVLKEPSEMVRDGINALASGSNIQTEEIEKSSSVLPTMWMGAQSGSLYVHSSVSQWKKCLHSVKLQDSILNIVHVKGRVLAALANGSVAIFHRDKDGQWDLENYHLLDLGKPHHSIRCMTVIANKHVWCGYKNRIHVVDPNSMSIEKCFDAHPRKESQVRQLAWVGDGVWVSIRLDSTLRLYHAYTHQHLQDVDIEPYVSKMLGTGKLGFSFVRITSMLISCNRLWIGTGNGVIISVPLSETNKQAVSMGSSQGRPGGLVRVYSDTKTDSVTPGSFIPYCTMAQAQLSFHGHKDAVKFFISVPVEAKFKPIVPQRTGKSMKGMSNAGDSARVQGDEADSRTRLVISGGEGYVDFRIAFKVRKYYGEGDDDTALLGEEEEEEKEEKASLSKGEKSHLIVWEVSTPES